MIQIPPWLLVLVAVWVIAFGVFRFHLARKKRADLADPNPDKPNFRKAGFYAQSPRRHVVFGALYLVMGGVLIAMAFGWKPPILGGGCSDADSSGRGGGSTIQVEPAPK